MAIHNFKTHFLSVLSELEEDFPTNLWDRLLPQTEITLNLLQQSNATPNVSAYAHLSGPFDYNKMPLAPMGCGAQMHKNGDKWGTWQYNLVDRWYLYTSPNHYRTHACHIKTTRKEQLTNTVNFHHKIITSPTITHADKVMHVIQQVIIEIRNLGGIENSQEAQDLQQLVNGANNYLQSTEHINTQPVPRVNCTQRFGNGESNPDNNPRNTDDRQPLPRVNQPTTCDKRLNNDGPPASRT